MDKSFVVAIILLSIAAPCFAAEYNGVDIDGDSLACSAFSYSTYNYYNITAVFSGSDVTITFSNGGSRTLSLDDDDIDDSSSISAFDYGNSVYWDLDCSNELD